MNGIILLLAVSLSLSGAVVPVPLQVVPQGIESVNGSDVNMGCAANPPAEFGGVTICGSFSEGVGAISYLVDGISPAIDTSTSIWASQLVTVRKNDANDDITFDHVVLTFRFDTAVSPTAIELDMLLCPELKIGAPYITVYADNNGNLVFRYQSGQTMPQSDTIRHHTPSKSSCDSLSTVSIPVQEPIGNKSYIMWHILVSFDMQPDIEWVHVGEVRFLDTSADPDSIPSSSSIEMPTPSTTTTTTTTTTSMGDTDAHTTTLQSVFSSMSHTTTNPPSTSDSTSNSNTAAIAAGVVAGLIALVLIVALVIGIYLFKKYRHSQVELEKLQNVVREQSVELKGVEKDDFETDNPLYVTSHPSNGHQPTTSNSLVHVYDSADCGGVDNPTYYSTIHDKPVAPQGDSVYTEVKKPTPKTAHERNNDKNTHVAVAQNKRKSPSPAPKESAPGPPIYSSVRKENMPSKVPELLTGLKAGNKAKNAESLPVYSAVHKEKVPVVPPKSSDLEEYLTTRDAVSQSTCMDAPPAPNKLSSLTRPLVGSMTENPTYLKADALSSGSRQSNDVESNMYALPCIHTTHPTEYSHDDGIYSEPINPSDFTHDGSQEMEDDDDDLQMYAPIYTDPTMLPESFQQPVAITSDNIKEREELGTGQFGKVVLAATNGLSLKDMRLSKTDDNRDISILVAVKKLKSNASKPQWEAFNKEVKFMSRLKHPNVVYFLGVCYDDPAFIMMEYMEEGDLNQFLQRYSEIVPITTPSNNTQITTSTVVHMASQIANAMQYLASLNFVHRDLASRNCLVGKNFTVKLADFGMSRNLYGSHYYRIQGDVILPIRWMATECFYGKFSEKTDVWAFGITMWELFTLAYDQPYPDLSDQEMIDDAIKGVHRQLLPKPAACPQSVYRVMQRCWAIDPKQRASFQEVDRMLQT